MLDSQGRRSTYFLDKELLLFKCLADNINDETNQRETNTKQFAPYFNRAI